MSRDDLRPRLEWLRLMGVDEIPARPGSAGRPPSASAGPMPGASGAPLEGAPRPAAAPGAPVRPEAATAQSRPGGGPGGLFGDASSEPPPAGRGARVEAPAGLAAVPAVPVTDPATALQAIRDDLGDCRRCRLCEKRTNLVFGVGDPRARLMFIGEGPGADEDRQGEPFVGRAGQLLNRIIESIGLTRSQVYIANVVKCRPPDNRTPLPDEAATCSPFLFRQIRAIAPRVIVCLGTPAAQTVLGTSATITRLRGAFHDLDGIRVMPTFHPAYLLRNPAAKKDVWEDMKQVMAALKAE